MAAAHTSAGQCGHRPAWRSGPCQVALAARQPGLYGFQHRQAGRAHTLHRAGPLGQGVLGTLFLADANGHRRQRQPLVEELQHLHLLSHGAARLHHAGPLLHQQQFPVVRHQRLGHPAQEDGTRGQLLWSGGQHHPQPALHHPWLRLQRLGQHAGRRLPAAVGGLQRLPSGAGRRHGSCERHHARRPPHELTLRHTVVRRRWRPAVACRLPHWQLDGKQRPESLRHGRERRDDAGAGPVALLGGEALGDEFHHLAEPPAERRL